MKPLVVEVEPKYHKSLVKYAQRIGFDWPFPPKDIYPESKYYFFATKYFLSSPFCITHSNTISKEEDYYLLEWPQQLDDIVDYLKAMIVSDELEKQLAEIKKEINE